MITQGGWIYKFIQFNLSEKCAIFFLNQRNMKGARYKTLLICLGTNQKLFIPEIMKLRVKILPKLNKGFNDNVVSPFLNGEFF